MRKVINLLFLAVLCFFAYNTWQTNELNSHFTLLYTSEFSTQKDIRITDGDEERTIAFAGKTYEASVYMIKPRFRGVSKSQCLRFVMSKNAYLVGFYTQYVISQDIADMVTRNGEIREFLMFKGSDHEPICIKRCPPREDEKFSRTFEVEIWPREPWTYGTAILYIKEK
ncbi:MAG TPA: hypothetical protein P5056_01940 [Candidatus Paceibacterota bacterium]|nr:hypothetical protein [Candidatus Paceibacterota bacterium]